MMLSSIHPRWLGSEGPAVTKQPKPMRCNYKDKVSGEVNESIMVAIFIKYISLICPWQSSDL